MSLFLLSSINFSWRSSYRQTVTFPPLGVGSSPKGKDLVLDALNLPAVVLGDQVHLVLDALYDTHRLGIDFRQSLQCLLLLILQLLLLLLDA
jgi:hypothetical protein